MKTKIYLIVILGLMTLNAQSVLTLGTGTTINVGASADFCAGSITGNGQLVGSGTFCGSPTGVESDLDNTLPTEYALEQNYPNPFNPSTKIRYSIPTSPLNPSPYQGEGLGVRSVILKIYDVLGNEIATLVDEFKPAGNYEVDFNASQLSSGIYLFKLQAGDPSSSSGQSFIQTKKMILIK